MSTWSIAEAKKNFSKIIELSQSTPIKITNRGKFSVTEQHGWSFIETAIPNIEPIIIIYFFFVCQSPSLIIFKFFMNVIYTMTPPKPI